MDSENSTRVGASVSIPFKREGGSQELQSMFYWRAMIWFQFPSNGKADRKEKIRSVCFNFNFYFVSIPSKREGGSQAEADFRRNGGLHKVSIPFKREGGSQEKCTHQ